nr:hypothetical protein [Ectobacillus panaciterrae]
MMSIRTTKTIKVPQDLTSASYKHKQKSLKILGFSVIEFCLHTQDRMGTMFLKDHLLLFVLKGVYTVRFGNQVHTVRSKEMVFLQNSIAIEYEKSVEAESGYVGLMFFLKEEMLDESRFS